MYEPLIIDRATPAPARFDKEFTMVRSAWNTTSGWEERAEGMGGMHINDNYFTNSGIRCDHYDTASPDSDAL